MAEDVSQNHEGQIINGGYLFGPEREPLGFTMEYPIGFHTREPT